MGRLMLIIIAAFALFVLIYFGDFNNWIRHDNTGSFYVATQAMVDDPSTDWRGLGLVVLVLVLLTVVGVAVELFRRKIVAEENKV